MSPADLAPRDRRTLALGGAVLLFLLLAFRGVPAWLAWRTEATTSAAELSRELQQTQLAIRGVRGALDTTEARVARLKAAAPALLVVEAPSEAPALLADVVREAARLSGVAVESLESRVDSAGGARLPHVVATVQGTGDVSGLSAFLHRLEGNATLLAVRELSVQPQSVGTPRDAVESLRIRMIIEGLAVVRGGEGSE
jgi:hypothetical protein